MSNFTREMPHRPAHLALVPPSSARAPRVAPRRPSPASPRTSPSPPRTLPPPLAPAAKRPPQLRLVSLSQATLQRAAAPLVTPAPARPLLRVVPKHAPPAPPAPAGRRSMCQLLLAFAIERVVFTPLPPLLLLCAFVLATPALARAQPSRPADAAAPASSGPPDEAGPAEAPPVELSPAELTAEVASLKESLGEARQELHELTSRSRENEQIMEELERKLAVQRVSWSAEYRATLSSFRFEGYSPDGARDADGTPREVTLKNLEQWTHRARLSLQADAGEALRFRARMSVFKRFGESAERIFSDGGSSRNLRDTTVRLDRFWIDWFITQKLSLSLGRISSTDGSPAELRENLERPASTFSAGLIDREYDAAVLTYQLGPLLVRGFYAGWQFARAEESYATLPFLARNSEPVRFYGAGVLWRPGRPRVPSLDLTAYWSPAFRAFPPFAFTPPGGMPVEPSKVPRSIGSVGGVSALVLSRDLIRGLDAFAALSLTHLDPNGKAVEYPIGPGGASIPVLVLSSTGAATHKGYQLYGGVRYTVPWGGGRAPRIGGELTWGSRYLANFSTNTSDLFSRLGVRGRTYDVYALQPISEALFARLSFTFIDHDYTPPAGGALGVTPMLGGTSPETKREITAVNLMLNAAF